MDLIYCGTVSSRKVVEGLRELLMLLDHLFFHVGYINMVDCFA